MNNTKKVCLLCSRTNDASAETCYFCGFAFVKKPTVAAEEKEGKVCVYCLGSGTTVGGKCTYCDGTGFLKEDAETRITCSYCVGTGKTIGGKCTVCDGKGWYTKLVKRKTCVYCSGSGTILGGEVCEYCKGAGSIPEKE